VGVHPSDRDASSSSLAPERVGLADVTSRWRRAAYYPGKHETRGVRADSFFFFFFAESADSFSAGAFQEERRRLAIGSKRIAQGVFRRTLFF
jgi:hypothetical protein